jgi:ATP-dependent Zn protease
VPQFADTRELSALLEQHDVIVDAEPPDTGVAGGPDQVKVTFDHVAGIDEVENESAETVDFLRDPERYGRLGARMPHGVLLSGPPGTGKTLLPRPMAGCRSSRCPRRSASG